MVGISFFHSFFPSRNLGEKDKNEKFLLCCGVINESFERLRDEISNEKKEGKKKKKK